MINDNPIQFESNELNQKYLNQVSKLAKIDQKLSDLEKTFSNLEQSSKNLKFPNYEIAENKNEIINKIKQIKEKREKIVQKIQTITQNNLQAKVNVSAANSEKPVQNIDQSSASINEESQATELRELFDRNRPASVQELPLERQNELFARCLSKYQESVKMYEVIAGKVLANDPEAIKFASDLCHRIYSLFEVYQEIKAESAAGAPPKQGQIPQYPYMNELKSKLELVRTFGAGSLASDSVGFNLFNIKNAIEEGSSKEHLSLAFSTLFSFFKLEILSSPEMIQQINKRLNDKQAGFQLNAELIEKVRNTTGFIPLPEHIKHFRDKEKGRKLGKTIKQKGVRDPSLYPLQGPKLKDIDSATLRTARTAIQEPITKEVFDLIKKFKYHPEHMEVEIAILQEELEANEKKMDQLTKNFSLGKIDENEFQKESEQLQSDSSKIDKQLKVLSEAKTLGERRVRWLSGSEMWEMNLKTSSIFIENAKKKGLPDSAFIAGPSGASDGILQACEYLGFKRDDLFAGTKALVSWLSPGKHHSMHEVLDAASYFGFPYKGGLPEDFGPNGGFGEKNVELIQSELEKQGLMIPSEYLSSQYQESLLNEK